MTIDSKIRDEKLHYNINRDAAKISALSSGKSINLSYGRRNTTCWSKRNDRASQVYSFSFRKSFWTQIKTIEDQGKRQVEEGKRQPDNYQLSILKMKFQKINWVKPKKKQKN